MPHWFVALSGLALIASVQAQQAPYYYQQPGTPQQPRYSVPPGSPPPRTYTPPPPAYQQPPPQQPQGTTSRVGGFFRRLFYGERNSPQGQGQYYGAPQGRSLDTPPAGYRPGMGFNEPPQAQTQPKIDPKPPTSSARAGGSRLSRRPSEPASPKSSSSKKYTPPKVKEDAPPSKPKSPTIGTEPSSPPSTPPSTPEPAPEPKFTPEPDPTTPDEPLPGYTPPSTTPPAGSGMATPKPKDPEPTTGSSNSGAFLVGKKTGKDGRVTSPYPPYKELDVTGLPSGSLALDPTTQKVFEVP